MTKKKKLTHGQIRRVKHNQQKKLTHSDLHQWNETMLGAARHGTTIARYGQHADIEDLDTKEVHRCNLRRSITSLVCGDKVLWRQGVEALDGIAGVVEAVQPRSSVLTRPDYYDGLKPVAANIDQLVIVSSVLPELSFNIIDRYLIAAEELGIAPVIVLNKIDLLSADELKSYQDSLNIYQDIGYRIILVSKNTGAGIDELTKELTDRTNVFVGQSGVGKSSLVNAVIPQAMVLEGAISENSALGQHTTTAAQLYHLPSGGDLIDSPGIREFGLWHLESDVIAKAYREFQPFLGLCKFRDCNHKNSPGCALQQALADGEISSIRFDNYHKIVASMQENRANRQYSSNKKSQL